MLTSSTAKWKCLWYLLVWSVQLTLASRFLYIRYYIAFYVLAAISVSILPLVTAVYSNTYGRRGSSLLRFFLVFCDPVLVCLTVTPVMLMNDLPSMAQQFYCLQRDTDWNDTLQCLVNVTAPKFKDTVSNHHGRQEMTNGVLTHMLKIQASLVVPILMVLLMGRRTPKMGYIMYLLCSVYWLLAAIESVSLLEAMLLRAEYERLVQTCVSILSIVMIVANCYGVVTLCSFVSPRGSGFFKGSSKFDSVYQVLTCVAGMFFVEVPMLVTRCQFLAYDVILPGSFYCWMIKDVCVMIIICMLLYVQRFTQNRSCLPSLLPPGMQDLHFLPEKRDRYLHQQAEIKRLQQQEQDDYKHSVVVIGNMPLKRHQSDSALHMSGSALDQSPAKHRKTSSSLSDLSRLAPKTFSRWTSRLKKHSSKGAKKSVKFKVDLGQGVHLELKPRSDSPPVICTTQFEDIVEIP